MAKRAMTAEAKALKANAILDKAAEMFFNSALNKPIIQEVIRMG